MKRLALWSVCLASALVSTGQAHAYPSEISPTYTGTYQCNDCHVSDMGGTGCNTTSVHPRRPCLNPMGAAYRSSGWTTAFSNQDADGDDYSNAYELPNATRRGGFHQGAIDVGCSMIQAAQTPYNWRRCGSSYVEVRAWFYSSPVNRYTFSYQCMSGTSPDPDLLHDSEHDWSAEACQDTNECAGNPCSPGNCTQRPVGSGWSWPGYYCTSCGAGYQATSTSCQLVDACMANTDNCVGIATCVDTPGSSATYTCECPHDGYQGDGRSPGSGCTNIDECSPDPCGAFGTGCTETPLGSWSAPGYTCTCQTGYDFNGTTCALEDECTAGLDDCHPVATCIDPSMRSGDFTCTCPAGYLGDGHGATGCRDIDECRSGADDCDTNAACTNTPGSFTCTCNDGYAGDGRRCTDIDECADPVTAATCDPSSTCRNLAGSYECNCNAGYRGDGLVSCRDIDECAEGRDDCDANATCTNSPGTFSCACDEGWSGDGRSCADIDECADPTFTSRCSTVAVCENSPGGWSCVCNDGYAGTGFECEDVDECEDGTHTCHPFATCNNTVGGFTCGCNEGYQGSGFDCTDVNECADGTHDCGPSEFCVNNDGAPFTCLCRPGYIVDEESGECVIACGDSVVGRGETCDDGNAEAGDGCDERCRVEPGYTCYEPTPGPSECVYTCGDEWIDTYEECDEGEEGNSDTEPDACRTNCLAAHCGDGVVDTGETCDDGDANSDEDPGACRTTCEPAWCGDGVVDPGEGCDPGGFAPGEAPADACTACSPPDAGPGEMPEPPPGEIEADCGCRAVPPSDPPWAFALLALGALLWRRRR